MTLTTDDAAPITPDSQSSPFGPIALEDSERRSAESRYGQSSGHTIALNSLLSLDYGAAPWPVPGLIPPGLTILAGPSKSGKSWLALDLALSAAIGRSVLGGAPCVPGDVLFWGLEDGPKRLQYRAKALLRPPAETGILNAGKGNTDKSKTLKSDKESPPPLHNLSIRTIINTPSALDVGGMAAIEGWAFHCDNPRLIVIDVIEKVRPVRRKGESEYAALHRGLSDLQAFAHQRGIAVVAVHHTSKNKRGRDPLSAIAGNRGMSAVADNCIILSRSSDAPAQDQIHKGHDETPMAINLYARGRDLPELDLSLLWHIQDGHAAWKQATTETAKPAGTKSRILDFMAAQTSGFTTAVEVGRSLGISTNAAAQSLYRLHREGLTEKHGYGRYWRPGVFQAQAKAAQKQRRADAKKLTIITTKARIAAARSAAQTPVPIKDVREAHEADILKYLAMKGGEGETLFRISLYLRIEEVLVRRLIPELLGDYKIEVASRCKRSGADLYRLARVMVEG